MKNIPTPILELTPIIGGQYEKITIFTPHPPPLSYVQANLLMLNTGGGYAIGDNIYVDVEVQFPDMTYHSFYWADDSVSSPPGSGPNVGPNNGFPMDQSATLQLLAYIGADVTQPHVQNEAAEFISILKSMHLNGVTNLKPTHFQYTVIPDSYNTPAIWFAVVVLVFWVAVWTVGLVMFFRIRRKQMPAASPVRTNPARFAPPSPPTPPPPSF